MPIVGGPSGRSPKGLAILTPDPANSPPEVAAIIDALKAADIPFDLKIGGDITPNQSGTTDFTKRVTEILVTARSI
jgi:hypothetical protein